MPEKILIVTDDSGESYEILYAYHRFLEAGYTPVIASSRKKRLNGVIHDFYPGWTTYIEKPGYLIQSDTTFEKVKASEFLGMMLIGGRAPEFLRHDKKLIRLVKKFHEKDKWMFAICHGIQVLITAGLVKGKKVTCYCNVRFEVQSAEGEWIDKQSVVDGKIITAQTWESHPEFYRNIFKNIPGPGGGRLKSRGDR